MDHPLEIKPTENDHELSVDADKLLQAAKNTRGELGPICNFCGGYGFTLAFGTEGNSKGCPRCFGTGVEPVNTWELQKQVIELAKGMKELKEIIIKFAGEKLQDTNENE